MTWNFKKKFIKQIELNRKTNFFNKFKNQLSTDWKDFCQFIKISNYFSSISQSIFTIFLWVFFPYLIICWCLIKLYGRVFIYLFIFFDLIMFNIFNQWLNMQVIYLIFRNLLFFILYNPLFIYLPKILSCYVIYFRCNFFLINLVIY